MSIDRASDWIVPHLVAESEQRLTRFPIGQRVRKLNGGWKWKGAIATVTGHKRQVLGYWEIQVRYDDAELEAYNQMPWGAQNLSMSEFEPLEEF